MKMRSTLIILSLFAVISLAIAANKWSRKCIKGCGNKPDGNYHSCKSCSMYVTCANKRLYPDRPCGKGTFFDGKLQSCVHKSTTCKDALGSKDATTEKPEPENKSDDKSDEKDDDSNNNGKVDFDKPPQGGFFDGDVGKPNEPSGHEFYPGCGCDGFTCTCSSLPPATCETTLVTTEVETTAQTTIYPSTTEAITVDEDQESTSTTVYPNPVRVKCTKTTTDPITDTITLTTTNVRSKGAKSKSTWKGTSTSTRHGYTTVTTEIDSTTGYDVSTPNFSDVIHEDTIGVTASVDTAVTQIDTTVKTTEGDPSTVVYTSTKTKYDIVSEVVTDTSTVTATTTKTTYDFNSVEDTAYTSPVIQNDVTNYDFSVFTEHQRPSTFVVTSSETQSDYTTKTHYLDTSTVTCTSTSTKFPTDERVEDTTYTNTVVRESTTHISREDTVVGETEIDKLKPTETTCVTEKSTSYATSTKVNTEYETITKIHNEGTCNFFATCSNHMKVYIDGVCQPGFWGLNDWKYVSMFKIPDNTKRIGIECHNIDSLGGILASSNNCDIKTNATWKCTDAFFDDWNQPNFVPDFFWETATTIGNNGVAPWGDRPGISEHAKWIWNSEYSGPKCTEKAYCIIELDDDNNQHGFK